MKLRDLIRSACAGLLQHKLRSLLTLGGVALGAMLLFCSISGGMGVLNALQRRLSVGDRLLTIRVSTGMKAPSADLAREFESKIPTSVSSERRKRLARTMALRSGRGKTAVLLTLGDLPRLEKIDGVRRVTPDLTWKSQVLLESALLNNVSVKAFRTDSESIKELVVFGSVPADDSANEVLVSESFLFSRGLQSDAVLKALIGMSLCFVRSPQGRLSDDRVAHVEQSILVRERILDSDGDVPAAQREILSHEIGRLRRQLAAHAKAAEGVTHSAELKIVGIYRSPDVDGFQANPQLLMAFYNHVLVPVDTATVHWRERFPADRAIVATVKADGPDVVQSVLATLKGQNYNCDSLADIAQRIRNAVLMISAVITAIATGAFLIAALGMTNTMVMNVLERRREIGILKAIGARNRDVRSMFLVEGLLAGVAGGVLGMLLALAVTRLSGDVLRSFLERRLDEPFHGALFAYPWWLVVATPLIAGLVTTLASLIPAHRAARLDPVEALRNL